MASWTPLIVKCGEIPIPEVITLFSHFHYFCQYLLITDYSNLTYFHQQKSSQFMTSEIKTVTTQLLAAETVKFLLLLASHMCMFMIYLQLGLLVYLVSLTQLKIGFIFLLACIVVIHVLVSEVIKS